MIKTRTAAALLAALAPALGGCHSGPSTPPGPTPTDLPAAPVPVSPVGGTQVTTDTPLLTVQNARGFDAGQASYTFRVSTLSGKRDLALFAVPAGPGTTSAAVPTPLPRGMTVSWKATATGAAGEVSSASATFRTLAVDCRPSRSPYAKSVVEFFSPACSLMVNKYTDPEAALGPPDAGGKGPDMYHGFVSLGDDGFVTVDMQSCAQDQPGMDIRVFQSVSTEPVTLWAAGTPEGPFQLVHSRRSCGRVLPGVFSGFCDFDLAEADVEEARFFKIQDGENSPCPRGTVTEGADIDAIEILHLKP